MIRSMIRGQRSRLAALLTAALLAWQAPPAAAQLPNLGGGSELALSAERQVGDRIARELFRDPDYIDDPMLAEYVASIWQPLLSAARQRGDLGSELDQRFAWQVLLGKDRSINAFALPGGWMGLHLGLIAASGTRDELAAVLAHELSHVTQRHISRLMTREKQQAPWMIGAMILAALAASKSPEAGKAVATGGQALALQNQLTFSRDMEREADRVGLGVLVQAGFRAQGFAGMFQRLQHSSRLNDGGGYQQYLRTHPLTIERIADMQSRQVLDERVPAPPDLEHALMAARARVLSAGGVDAMAVFVREATAATSPDLLRQAPVLYAGALAAGKRGDQPMAQDLRARLAALVEGKDKAAARAVRLLATELTVIASQPAATPAAPAATGLGSATRPELLLGAQLALRSGQPGEAVQALQTWVAVHPNDGTAWQLLARASAAQGQTLRAIRAEAEAQVAWMDYAGAMDRLRAAQDLAHRRGADHIEASIIDTRVRQVESLLREQALER